MCAGLLGLVGLDGAGRVRLGLFQAGAGFVAGAELGAWLGLGCGWGQLRFSDKDTQFLFIS